MLEGRTYHGAYVQCDSPEWKPLVDLVGEDVVGNFMWMCEIELSSRTRVHAYKHIHTRRYIHLAADGTAFAYIPRGRYRTVSAADVLAEVFAVLPGLYGVTDAEIARSWAAVARCREAEDDREGRHA